MDLLTQTTRDNITGAFYDFFTTMSSASNNYISVIKQPISQINNLNENVIPGFSAESLNIQDITYQPVTGVFPALIIYPHTLKSDQFGQLKFQLDENQILIKVEKNTRDYLLNGKTERIIANDNVYNMEITPTIQNFFGLKFYYFKLTSTR